MSVSSGKKIIIIDILQILQKYTDEDHKLTQQQIIEKLQEDYDLTVDRGAIKRNLAELIEAGYNIQFTEITRAQKNRKTGEIEENSIYTDIYYEHDFTEPELHFLIDGLLFSRSVPYGQRKHLIDKLGKLSNVYFNRKMNHIRCMSENAPQNRELFHTIEVLDVAISQNKQVEITYNQYGTDLKLHPTKEVDGKTTKRHILNPYQIVAKDGRYYLICNNDHHEAVGSYRVDRITNIKLLSTDAKPRKQVKGLENGLNLQNHIYQNIDMFVGEIVDVEFLIDRSLVGFIVDIFGNNISFHETDGNKVKCHIKASFPSIKRWAVMFANIAKVTSPQNLVDEIKKEIGKSASNYDMRVVIQADN